jgi:hypothetical protein
MRQAVPPSTYYAAVVITAFVFLLTMLVVWFLHRVSRGSMKTDVKASAKAYGARIWVHGDGLFGAFIAIAILGLLAVYWFSH